jgi:hypothetical protein
MKDSNCPFVKYIVNMKLKLGKSECTPGRQQTDTGKVLSDKTDFWDKKCSIIQRTIGNVFIIDTVMSACDTVNWTFHFELRREWHT